MYTNLIQSVIGNAGPLIVEHNGHIMIENCITIHKRNIENIIKKLEKIKFSKIEQTTDRSFMIY